VAKIVVPTPNTVITSAWGTSVADALNLDWELAYAERTTTMAIGTGVEANANSIAITGAITLDAHPILLEFFAPQVTLPAGVGSVFNVWFFQDAVSLGLASVTMSVVAGQGTVPVYAARRLAAPTGSHAYSVRAACSAGTGSVNAGTGGAGTGMPAFLRITRAAGPTF
jgi:hypothetical protein